MITSNYGSIGVVLCLCGTASGQEVGRTTVELQHRVESGLRPAFQVKGHAPVKWSLEDRMRHYRIPGLSLAVIDGGKLAWAKGYGVRTFGKTSHVTAETRFQAGLASPVALLAALRCVREGKLDLLADIAGYLKSWKLPEREASQRFIVSLRNLLTDSAGLTETDAQEYPLRSQVLVGSPNSGITQMDAGGYSPSSTLPTSLDILNGQAPAISPPVDVVDPPGLKAYVGEAATDLLLLQRVLEDVTHEPYSELAQRAVLSPLNLIHTTYAEPKSADWNADFATGHVDSEPLRDRWHCYPGTLDQQLWTKPSDVAQMLMEIAGAAAGISDRVIDRDLAQQILTPQVPGRGLGFDLHGSGRGLRMTRNGNADGYYTALVLYPNTGQGAVIMTNGQRSELLVRELLRSLAAEYGWSSSDFTPREHVQFPIAMLHLTHYAGYFEPWIDPNRLTQVRIEGNRLISHMSQERARPARDVELLPVLAGSFVCPEDDSEWSFLQGPNGSVTGLLIQRGGDVTYLPRLAGPPVPLMSPTTDPSPERTATLRRVLVQLSRHVKSSSELNLNGNVSINQLYPMGISESRMQKFEPLKVQAGQNNNDLGKALWVFARIVADGKTLYYRFTCSGDGKVDWVQRVYEGW